MANNRQMALQDLAAISQLLPQNGLNQLGQLAQLAQMQSGEARALRAEDLAERQFAAQQDAQQAGLQHQDRVFGLQESTEARLAQSAQAAQQAEQQRLALAQLAAQLNQAEFGRRVSQDPLRNQLVNAQLAEIQARTAGLNANNQLLALGLSGGGNQISPELQQLFAGVAGLQPE